jgi:glycosyltransferase involved in cell wall biosynthesis
MKILIVSTSDISGGAARAAYRLHRSLLKKNINSSMLVQNKHSDDFTIETISNTKMQKVTSKLRPILDSIPIRFYKNRTKTLFSSSWLGFGNIVNKINEINPDIVHLHWINGGMINMKSLSKINAPIVWSCQDMWPLTGGCHYDEECHGYEKQCGNCLVLNSNRENDLSRFIFKNKLLNYNKIKNLTIVGVSKWITRCAKESKLFNERKILNIPNSFDTNLFKPLDSNFTKELFMIPKDKKIILFGAMNSLGDPRKGANELFDALSKLDIENTIFVVAGSSKPKVDLNLKYKTYFIPPIHDETLLPLMYNTADVVIVPSLQENLANSIIESLSCGVPVVAFDIGGNKDMIEHKQNGYLANKLDTQDMANGIKWILEDCEYNTISKNSREKVLKNFDATVVSSKYINLYKNILGEKNDSI